jgi:hypothetical protein
MKENKEYGQVPVLMGSHTYDGVCNVVTGFTLQFCSAGCGTSVYG